MAIRKTETFRCAAFPRRTAGVVLHVSSLPGPGPVGSLGAGARAWIDCLAEAGFGWWQVCPLGPTGYGDSPYQPLSAFALNPYFIDLGELREEGLLIGEELAEIGDGEDSVDYGRLWTELRPLLGRAARRAAKDPSRLARWGDLEAFRTAESSWLRDWERFSALREANGFRAPSDWKAGEVDPEAGRAAAALQQALA